MSVLWICEMAARNLKVEFGDFDQSTYLHGAPITMKAPQREWRAFTTTLAYLQEQASAAWRPEFGHILSRSHSLRVERIDATEKNNLRPSGKCMACGRPERNCHYAIDLAGNVDMRKFHTGASNIAAAYEDFATQYTEVFDAGWLEIPDTKKSANQDNGRFIVGETCLRKAKLRYLVQSLVAELCYAAEREVEELKGMLNGVALNPQSSYTATRKAGRLSLIHI